MSEPQARILGYEAPIYQAVWKRVSMMGGPRTWSTVWVALCMYAGLITFTLLGLLWVLGVAVLWALGQGVLILLTQWEPGWDEIAIAQVVRRYRAYYAAG